MDTDADPGGPKTYGMDPADPDPQVFLEEIQGSTHISKDQFFCLYRRPACLQLWVTLTGLIETTKNLYFCEFLNDILQPVEKIYY
jgi:hypothetical protein